MKKNNSPLLGRRFRYVSDFRGFPISPYALELRNRVKQKIKSSIYQYQQYPCFCGSNGGNLLAEVDRYGNYYPVVLCENCGLVRAEPRMTASSYQQFYKEEYRGLYGDEDVNKDRLWELRLAQAEGVFNFISANIKIERNMIVFDIGCNMGTTLVPFSKAGCKVYGLDYNTDYLNYGRKKTGFRLEEGGLDKVKDYGQKANLLILNHVLEHVSELERDLTLIREVIEPEAVIFIAVPGTFWWIKNICQNDILGLLQNAHLWQFSLESLRYVMECCGFKYLCGNEEIRALFKADNIGREKKDVPYLETRKVLNYLISIERKFLLRLYLKRLIKMYKFLKIENNTRGQAFMAGNR